MSSFIVLQVSFCRCPKFYTFHLLPSKRWVHFAVFATFGYPLNSPVCQDPRKPQPMVQEKPKTEDTAPSISVESCYARGWCGMGTRCRLCQSPNPLERPKCYCVTERFGYQDSRKPQPLVHDQLKTEDSMPSISWCDSRL